MNTKNVFMFLQRLQNKQTLNQPTLQALLHFSNPMAKAKNSKEPAIFQRHQLDKTVQKNMRDRFASA